MVDSTKMLEVIRLSPGIRTMQLVDRLDEEIDDVEIALQRELNKGVIQAHDVIAPNKRRAIAFTMAGVPLPDDTVNTEPLRVAPSAKPMTKIERAIAFIKEQPDGRATSAQLATLLELKPNEFPSSYLSGGLKDNRLIKIGKYWQLGTGVSPEKPAVAEKAPIVAKTAAPDAAKPASVSENAHVDSAPAVPVKATIEVPAFLPAPRPASAEQAGPDRFQCAVWSSGELQLVRGECEIIKLTAEETRTVREYLSRVKGPLVTA
jgi:hypothetical protein